MAQIYEYAAGRDLYQNDVDMMVTHLGEILTATIGENITTSFGASRSYIGMRSFLPTNGRDDGFGRFHDDSNQVRHFTAGFKMGYFDNILSYGINL